VLFNTVAILLQKLHHKADHSNIFVSWIIARQFARHICFRVVAKRTGANIFDSGLLSKNTFKMADR